MEDDEEIEDINEDLMEEGVLLLTILPLSLPEQLSSSISSKLSSSSARPLCATIEDDGINLKFIFFLDFKKRNFFLSQKKHLEFTKGRGSGRRKKAENRLFGGSDRKKMEILIQTVNTKTRELDESKVTIPRYFLMTFVTELPTDKVKIEFCSAKDVNIIINKVCEICIFVSQQQQGRETEMEIFFENIFKELSKDPILFGKSIQLFKVLNAQVLHSRMMELMKKRIQNIKMQHIQSCIYFLVKDVLATGDVPPTNALAFYPTFDKSESTKKHATKKAKFEDLDNKEKGKERNE